MTQAYYDHGPLLGGLILSYIIVLCKGNILPLP